MANKKSSKKQKALKTTTKLPKTKEEKAAAKKEKKITKKMKAEERKFGKAQRSFDKATGRYNKKMMKLKAALATIVGAGKKGKKGTPDKTKATTKKPAKKKTETAAE